MWIFSKYLVVININQDSFNWSVYALLFIIGFVFDMQLMKSFNFNTITSQLFANERHIYLSNLGFISSYTVMIIRINNII